METEATRRRASPKRVITEVRRIAVETLEKWIADRGPERGAALSFYVVLSLGPLLTLLVGGLELLAAEGTVRPILIDAVQRIGGARAAATADMVLREADPPDLLSPASLLTVGTLGFAATAAFANVRGALNAIWGVAGDQESIKQQVIGFLRTRVRSFLMLAATGAIVGVSFLVTSLATVLYDVLRAVAPFPVQLIQIVDVGLSIAVLGLLFGVLYRTLPDVRIEWSSVWIGAFGTAVLFVIGKVLLARLVGTLSWTSYYGPGTSAVVFLAWLYFSAQIFFLGAEFTQVWSRRRGGVLDLEDGQAS